LSYRSVGPVKSPLRSSFLASQLPRRFLPAVAEPLPPRPDPAKCALCDPCQRLGPVFSIGFPVRFVKCISRAPPRHPTQRSSVGRPPAAGTSGSEAGAQGAEEPGKTEPCRHLSESALPCFQSHIRFVSAKNTLLAGTEHGAAGSGASSARRLQTILCIQSGQGIPIPEPSSQVQRERREERRPSSAHRHFCLKRAHGNGRESPCGSREC
jgi:hypothetical protein